MHSDERSTLSYHTGNTHCEPSSHPRRHEHGDCSQRSPRARTPQTRNETEKEAKERTHRQHETKPKNKRKSKRSAHTKRNKEISKRETKQRKRRESARTATETETKDRPPQSRLRVVSKPSETKHIVNKCWVLSLTLQKETTATEYSLSAGSLLSLLLIYISSSSCLLLQCCISPSLPLALPFVVPPILSSSIPLPTMHSDEKSTLSYHTGNTRCEPSSHPRRHEHGDCSRRSQRARTPQTRNETEKKAWGVGSRPRELRPRGDP